MVDISKLLMDTGGKISGGPQAEGKYVIVFPEDTDAFGDIGQFERLASVLQRELKPGK